MLGKSNSGYQKSKTLKLVEIGLEFSHLSIGVATKSAAILKS